jgi:zinc transport system substrate-binding protein
MVSLLLWPRGTAASESQIRVVASFYPVYIAVLNVVGDAPGVSVVSMARTSVGCLHDYQMTTEDMVTLSQADVFVVNGLAMESFLDVAKKQRPGMRVIEAGAGIVPITTGGESNPHVWVSLSLHRRQIRNIADGLVKADPAHAELYRRNADAYDRKLEALTGRMRAALKDLKSRDIVTMHEAFPYFAKEFGLNVVKVIEREPGSEPSAREMAETIRMIKQAGVRAVFAEPQYPAKAAEAIARETGVALHVLDPVVGGPETADAYLHIMEHNLKELVAALR